MTFLRFKRKKKKPMTTATPVPVTVALVNQSTVLSDTQVSAVVPALQTQVSRDFAPLWGQDATIKFVPKGQSPAPTDWQLIVLDDSDQAGALGYHDVTANELPLAKVFAKSDLQYNMQWSVTVSHELLEMLADPEINQVATVYDANGNMMLLAWEDCDAVEDDSLGYSIDGVLVSDFVTKAWFVPGKPGPYDFQGHVTKPLQILKGGYIGVWTPQKGWTQDYGRHVEQRSYRHRAQVGSRRERRSVPRHQWLKSEQ